MTRIITPADLQGRSLTDLQALYYAVRQEFAESEPGSQGRRDAIVSLEAISLAIARRRALSGPGP
jgi:hypothetical protein